MFFFYLIIKLLIIICSKKNIVRNYKIIYYGLRSLNIITLFPNFIYYMHYTFGIEYIFRDQEN